LAHRVGNPASGLVAVLVLLLQVAWHVSGSYAVLALATNDDTQAGDALEYCLLHGWWGYG
jgi:desulfoferrodoxin (superoxide reductase-like protein)